MRKTYFLYLLTGMLLFLTTVTSGKETQLNSIWKQAEIKVDGDESEWSGSMYYLEEQKVGLGLKNDTSDLYIIIKAADRNTQLQIMRTGLTIWLDAKGKKEKTLGIHYPIGMQDYGIPMVMGQKSEENKEERQKQFTEMTEKIEILGPEKNERNRIARVNNSGIQASINDTLGIMVCELKIPLKKTDEFPYAIAAKAGDIISLGLETGEFKREKMKGNMHMGEGMPGGRGGMPPGGGSPPGGMHPRGREGIKMPEQIKFWAQVTLATGVTDKN
jgi:hypothetical protein